MDDVCHQHSPNKPVFLAHISVLLFFLSRVKWGKGEMVMISALRQRAQSPRTVGQSLGESWKEPCTDIEMLHVAKATPPGDQESLRYLNPYWTKAFFFFFLPFFFLAGEGILQFHPISG